MSRPILIDESDGPCPHCVEWAASRPLCDDCGQATGDIDACVPHHFHLRGIGPSGIPGRAPVAKILCKECAIALRLTVYPPGETSPSGKPHPTAEAMREYRG